MTKAIKPVSQWLGYSGNKRKLIPLIIPLVPQKTRTFVDLFGGSGIVGCNAFRFNRCERVVYNDLEYDLMLLMAYLHSKPAGDILRWQDELIKRWFGDDEFLTKENRRTFYDIQDYYNDRRIILWDSKRRSEDVLKVARCMRDEKRAVELLNWYAAGEDDGKRTPNMPGKVNMEAHGDYADLTELLFLVTHSFRQTTTFADDGRRATMTPRTDVRLRRPEAPLVDFCSAWSKTPVEFCSCDFTSAFFNVRPRKRPRSETMTDYFRSLIEGLDRRDFVFIDPPYHGSQASYNAKWKNQLEIYLLAFCQLLNERGVPFLLTNNLEYNKTVFAEWRKQFHCYKIRDAKVKLYSGKNRANAGEVFVSNLARSGTQYKLHPDLEPIPRGE